MIKFLIQRPIAVLMAFTACFIIGLVTYSTLPISLLPNIAIPEITIQVSAANTSARELENTIVKPLRSQLIQVSTLKDIHSESRDGAGIIRLSFDFGTNTDLAFIEVNEKIDAAMNYLPKETERPKVIKASATDIPVLHFCFKRCGFRLFFHGLFRFFQRRFPHLVLFLFLLRKMGYRFRDHVQHPVDRTIRCGIFNGE